MKRISMYVATVPVFIRSLEAMRGILTKAEAFAIEKKIDENILLQARLAVDMFPFVKQVQVVCDNAKGTAARIAGIEAPKFEDNEKTLLELKERIEKTLVFLCTLKEEQFVESEERKVPIYFMPGKYLLGLEYLTDMALPNFYFHLTTAYDILRHFGLNIGKADYIGQVQFKDE